MLSRDYRQTADRVIKHCDVCRISAPLKPEQVEQWDVEHNHEGEKQ